MTEENDFCVSISDELYEVLKKRAEDEGVSFDDYIEMLMEFSLLNLQYIFDKIKNDPEKLKELADDVLKFDNQFQVENHIN